MINDNKRIEAAYRRFKFEALKAVGIFWVIENVLHLGIKEPWNKLYKRSNK
tara:strand:+ start:57 stop:209 length:153 start_codon:yes stop_codon:yes gene_type:complete